MTTSYQSTNGMSTSGMSSGIGSGTVRIATFSPQETCNASISAMMNIGSVSQSTVCDYSLIDSSTGTAVSSGTFSPGSTSFGSTYIVGGITLTAGKTYYLNVNVDVNKSSSGASAGILYSGSVTGTSNGIQWSNATAYEVEIDWSYPAPSAPSNVSPSGAVTIDTTYDITWTASTDPNFASSALDYEVDLSTDGGATWETIEAQTAAGATSFVYDFTNTPSSTNCLIRVRAWNGYVWGPYAQSASAFTVHHDVAPSAPSNVVPSGGEVINTTYNITWTAATDSDTAQSILQYEIDLSQDDGSTWTTLVALTAAGATSYTYDFTNTPGGSTNLIRIRAYDGKLYGPYAQSAGVFTIQHDQAPTAPTNLSPSSGTLNQASPITATWTFNDPDAGDAQSAFDIKWTTNGGSTWTEYDNNQSTSSSYQWPANTFSGATVQWMVRTYDKSGLASPWSAQAQFTTGAVAATPTITSPANNAVVNVANPTVQWTSSGQAQYQLQVQDTNGAVLWDSGTVVSTATAYTLNAYNLANNTSYVLALRLAGSNGLWGAYTTNAISVSYTPPGTTTLTEYVYNTQGYLRLQIINPSSGTAVDHNDLYRRQTGTSAWTRIATGLPVGTSTSPALYLDYAVASGANYDYKVTAVGTNGTSSDSNTVSSVTVGTLWGLWLHDVMDPYSTAINLKHMINLNAIGGTTPTTEQWTPQATTLQFAGRKDPNVFFGEAETTVVTKGKVSMFDEDGLWPQLKALLLTRPTLCLRDGRGRKAFGAVLGYTMTDLTGGSQVDVALTQTSYSEAV